MSRHGAGARSTARITGTSRRECPRSPQSSLGTRLSRFRLVEPARVRREENLLQAADRSCCILERLPHLCRGGTRSGPLVSRDELPCPGIRLDPGELGHVRVGRDLGDPVRDVERDDQEFPVDRAVSLPVDGLDELEIQLLRPRDRGGEGARLVSGNRVADVVVLVIARPAGRFARLAAAKREQARRRGSARRAADICPRNPRRTILPGPDRGQSGQFASLGIMEINLLRGMSRIGEIQLREAIPRRETGTVTELMISDRTRVVASGSTPSRTSRTGNATSWTSSGMT